MIVSMRPWESQQSRLPNCAHPDPHPNSPGPGSIQCIQTLNNPDQISPANGGGKPPL
jgi:hypothetical protein